MIFKADDSEMSWEGNMQVMLNIGKNIIFVRPFERYLFFCINRTARKTDTFNYIT